jgi:4'-phosphopantetheinyl transferase
MSPSVTICYQPKIVAKLGGAKQFEPTAQIWLSETKHPVNTQPPDALIHTIVDPMAAYAHAAWALDFGSDSAPQVSVLADQSALPPRPPSAKELFLWFGVPRLDNSEELLPYLHEAEREQVAWLNQPADRWSFAAAHVGVRSLLATALGCSPREVAFLRGARGKPDLDPARHGDDTHRVHFNISHTRGLVAVALAGRPVGVDVERVREISDMHAVGETVFANESLSALAETVGEAARTALFFRFWTLGEAFIKATGEGLTQGLKTFAFNASGAPRLTRVDGQWSPAARWRFGTFPN